MGGGGEGFPGKLLQTGSKLFRLLKFPNAVLETVSISRVIAFFIHVYFERALRFLKVTDILQPLNLTFDEILSLSLSLGFSSLKTNRIQITDGGKKKKGGEEGEIIDKLKGFIDNRWIVYIPIAFRISKS